MHSDDSDVPAGGRASGGLRPAVIAYLGLGSNLGRRDEYLKEAVHRLGAEPHIEIIRVSSLYETTPVGGPPHQGLYLNAAVAISTGRPPQGVLHCAQQIEKALGRERMIANGPRTIDIDLLLYGDQTDDEGYLTVPHLRLHRRRFVLEPLAEIAPDVVHPVFRRSIRELLEALPAGTGDSPEAVRLYQAAPWVET